MSDDSLFLDVTELLHEAAKEMAVGEMIHGENFSLQEAMSAIGLMNPKMDVGYGDRVKAEDVDLDWNIGTEQIVALLDELLAREAVWLEAHTLPQTVYACVYLLRLSECESTLLFSVLRLTAARIALQKDIITRSKSEDEEDFVAWTFGIDLLPILTMSEHLSLIEKIYDALPGNDDDPYVEALRHRIQFREIYYVCLLCMSRCQHLEFPQEVIEKLDLAIHALKKSRDSMAKVPAPGFDERVNRHLLMNSPPRKNQAFSVTEAHDYFERVLNQMRNLCKLSIDFLTVDSGLTGCMLLNSLNLIAIYNATSRPSVLVRCILRRQIVDITTISKLIADHQVDRESLGSTFHRTIIHLLKTMSRNRGRQRRKILSILSRLDQEPYFTMSPEELSSDQTDLGVGRIQRLLSAATIGRDNNQTHSSLNLGQPNSAVTLLLAETDVFILTHHLFLGFECDLYSPFELHAVYLNLTKLLEISRALHSCMPTRSGLRSFYRLYEEGKMLLSRVLEIEFRVAKLHWHPNERAPFGSEEKWYNDRFQVVTEGFSLPTFVSYREYVEGRSGASTTLADAGNELSMARKCFKEAMDLAKSDSRISSCLHEEVKDLAKTAVANAVELARASTSLQNEVKNVEVKFLYHRHFPVISIQFAN